VTLLPTLTPGVAAGFAAGLLVSVACLLAVIALQRGGWQRAGPPRSVRQRSRLGTGRLRRTRVPRGGGKHAAPVGGSTWLAARRRSRVLTSRD
jgi:hypothetical protein